jgi:hypothetical protein
VVRDPEDGAGVVLVKEPDGPVADLEGADEVAVVPGSVDDEEQGGVEVARRAAAPLGLAQDAELGLAGAFAEEAAEAEEVGLRRRLAVAVSQAIPG